MRPDRVPPRDPAAAGRPLTRDSRRRAQRFPATATLVAALALSAACADERGGPAPAREAPPARPDVLLITVDTLRPDALGWVSGGGSTPATDRLAREGVAFPAAVAPAPLTLPSHVSMFSGRVPRRHGVRDNHQVLGAALPLLPERLAAAGYATAAVVSGYPLTAPFGIDRGFAHYDDTLTAGEGAWLERPAGETAAAAREWLAGAASPWLLWVHFYDPHLPYEPPAEFRGEGWRGGYDGEVAYVDAEIGALLAAARSASGGELLTVFAGDHGESLGEHGENTHGFFIYDATMLVPMIFHWPGRLAPARREQPARLVDLGPTVLGLLDLPPLPGADGASLAPLFADETAAPLPAYLETRQPWNSYGWAPLAAIRHDGWKLISAPRPELYDLAADPGETENLVERERDRARRLARLLREAEALPAARAAEAADPETLERLGALGYLGTGAPAGEPPATGLADPKDRAALRELLTAADESLRAGDLGKASAHFRQALEEDPDNRFAQVRLGMALRRAGDLAAALPAFARAVALSPDDPEARTGYAEALMAAKRFPEAGREWMEVVRLQPRRALAWSNLGASLGLSGRPAEALTAYRRAAQLEPESPERWIRLAFAAHAAGDRGAAIRHLEQAASLTGAEAFPHPGALGLLLLAEGRSDQAAAWLARSRPAEGDYPQARLALIRHELAAGRRAEARRLLQETLRTHPDLRGPVSADPALSGLLK